VAAASEEHAEARFTTADVHELPFVDDSFDVVVCFEVIEHVDGQDGVIAELARVLAPGGVLAISSPNRGVYPSGNPHHLHEFTSEELRAALASRFAHVELRRQHDWVASAILDDAEVGDGQLRSLDVEIGKILGLTAGSETYVLGLASDEPLPEVPGRVVLGSSDEVREGLRQAAFVRTAEADIAYLQGVEAQLRADNATLLTQLEATQATLRRIHASPLWRLSKPLRSLRHFRR
jgi:SAM-dependent methyltransferase